MSRTAESLDTWGAEPETGSSPPAVGEGNGHAEDGHRIGEQGVGAPLERAGDLELLGPFAHSGHRRAPALVRRGDGQIVQLTPLLYEVLAAIDGRRGYKQIATAVGEKIDRVATAEDIRFLTEKKLRPLGLLSEPDGSRPALRKANPLLALRFRIVITDTNVTARIAGWFSKLFLPPVVLAFTLSFLLTTGWLLIEKGLASPVRQAIYEPALLLLVFALTTLSAGFHELGHAAACRYGGATPSAMGVGLYLVWPAFYTDVTDAYRLERRGRLRVDLGGIYFNAIFAVAIFCLWTATGWDALLVVIPLQALQMLRQLVPLLRLDGYHILADITGVPDLFAHIKPILLGMLPTRWGSAEAKRLRPWVRIVVTAWVVIVVPVLLFALLLIIATLPRVAATAWDSLGRQWDGLLSDVANRDAAGSMLRVLSIFALAIPVMSVCYLLTRITRRTASRVWRATKDRPALRVLAIVTAAGLLAGIATLWWPEGQYRPIGPGERGSFVDVRFRKPPLFDQTTAAAHADNELPAATAFGKHPPVRYQRSPALPVHEQIEASTSEDVRSSLATSTSGSDPASSHLPFPLPSPPGEGDNQALAVNTKDGSLMADLAFELLMVTEDIVGNNNEAYALASCVDCATVAIAFQVILLMDQADVIVPENVAVAVNAACVNCLTYAVAMQLILSVTDPPTGDELKQLEAIRARLEDLEANADDLTLDEILAELTEIETSIIELLSDEGGEISQQQEVDTTTVDPGATSDPTASPTTSPGGPDATPTPASSTEPSPSPGSDPTPSPSGEPSPSPSPSSSPEPTPSPTP